MIHPAAFQARRSSMISSKKRQRRLSYFWCPALFIATPYLFLVFEEMLVPCYYSSTMCLLLHSAVLQEYSDHSEKNLSRSIQNIKNYLPLKCIVGRISLVVCLQHLVLSFPEE